jgi:predicted DNA-binding transcriptional regulator AlpA
MEIIETEKLVYTVDEVSRLLQISRNLCFRLCRERKIPGVIFLGSRRMVVSAAAIRRLLEGNDQKED